MVIDVKVIVILIVEKVYGVYVVMFSDCSLIDNVSFVLVVCVDVFGESLCGYFLQQVKVGLVEYICDLVNL